MQRLSRIEGDGAFVYLDPFRTTFAGDLRDKSLQPKEQLKEGLGNLRVCEKCLPNISSSNDFSQRSSSALSPANFFFHP